MKKSALWIAGVLLCCAAVGARADDSNEIALVRGMDRFAFDLYGRVRSEGGNMFCSPYSISTALAMTYAGARGMTETQMATVLHFDLPQDELHPACGGLMRELRAESEGYEMAVANRLWVQEGYRILGAFSGLLAAQYDAEPAQVDFVRQTEIVRQAINVWVEKKTKNKIKELFKPGLLKQTTRLVLVNAIYFHGKWETPFSRKATSDAPFRRADGSEVTATMMRQTDSFSYAEERGVQVLEMAYAGGDVSMLVVLPRDDDGLADVERQLSADKVNGWLASLESRKVNVTIPRFKTVSDFELSDTLAAMGMPDAFSGKADFSGISGGKDLFISAVVHKVFIEVNEEGTEAAAATGVGFAMTAAPSRERPVEFVADHPFLVLLRDSRSGAILFIGRVADPSA
ncbi:MAG: serpin family protein [Kiritimatiellae bacterium]|nr:serpin family protein [Kiritimatiellia bacterium]